MRSLTLHLLQAGALEAGDVLWEESCFYVRAPHSVQPWILHVVDSVVFFREPAGDLHVSLLSFQGEGYNKPLKGEHTPRPAPLRGAAPTAKIHVTLASTYKLPIASTHLRYYPAHVPPWKHVLRTPEHSVQATTLG